jgi:hypothetical protein
MASAYREHSSTYILLKAKFEHICEVAPKSQETFNPQKIHILPLNPSTRF